MYNQCLTNFNGYIQLETLMHRFIFTVQKATFVFTFYLGVCYQF